MSNKIFVARLPWAITKDSLKAYFSKFGDVTDSIVVTDRSTGRSKGFGFVTFGNTTDIDNVINSLHEMDGREVVVSKHREFAPNERRDNSRPRTWRNDNSESSERQ